MTEHYTSLEIPTIQEIEEMAKEAKQEELEALCWSIRLTLINRMSFAKFEPSYLYFLCSENSFDDDIPYCSKCIDEIVEDANKEYQKEMGTPSDADEPYYYHEMHGSYESESFHGCEKCGALLATDFTLEGDSLTEYFQEVYVEGNTLNEAKVLTEEDLAVPELMWELNSILDRFQIEQLEKFEERLRYIHRLL
jgi:hypothetical protein